MTTARFAFQQECAQKYSGPVIDVGMNTDPAGLKGLPNVIGCDITSEYNGLKYPVDHVFDCTEDTWPFENDFADLVIFGDIIEHLYPEQLIFALKETRRISHNVCATIPKDERIFEDGYQDAIKGTPKGLVHVFAYSEEQLRKIFIDTGWDIWDFQRVDYGFVPEGYFIQARRK